jgi:anti-sigma factor RsiW
MAVCLNEETLQAYLDGELAPEVDAAVQTHLNGCAVCAARAREVEQELILFSNACRDELPESVPTTILRARVEAALAATSTAAVLSVRQLLFDSLSRRLWAWNLSPLRLVLVVTTVIVAVVLGGKLANRFRQSDTSEPEKVVVRQNKTDLPQRSSSGQRLAQEQHSWPAILSRRNQVKRAHRARPELTEKIDLPTEISTVRHRRSSGNATLWGLEKIDHLRQTQLLLRSFRNTLVEEGETAFDVSYEKKLSRELLGKNRLLRRSAVNREDSRTEELLIHIEPLLLDIANLPDKPSQTEVISIKELIREQKIIARLQINSGMKKD